MLSNLPPGVTHADIEAQCAPGIEETFEEHNEFTDKEIKAWENPLVKSLVLKALEWANQVGINQGIWQEKENQFYANR